MDIKEMDYSPEMTDNQEIDRRNRQLQVDRIKRKREQMRRRRTKNRIISLFTVIAVSAASFGWAYTASAKEVTITEINEFAGTTESVVVKTRVDNVGELLNENGVSIGDADKLNVSPESELGDGNEIVLTRGKQVTIITNEGEAVANVTKADAADALAEAGYVTGEADEITADGDTISVVAVEEKTETVTTDIGFDTTYTDDSSMVKGTTKVLTAGKNGSKETAYRVVYRDGVEASREVISENVISNPVTQVIARGTKVQSTVTAPAAKGTASSSDTGSTINGMKYKKKITMQATAYSTSPSENGGYTVSAKGNPLRHGIVAVDPRVVPLGSKVYVESTDGSWVYGVASAEDTGGAIKGNRIDLCYEGSVASVNTFGRRSCNVYILE